MATQDHRKCVKAKKAPPTQKSVGSNNSNHVNPTGSPSANQVPTSSNSDTAVQILFSFYQLKCADEVLAKYSIDWESESHELVNGLTKLVTKLDAPEPELTMDDVNMWLKTLLLNTKPNDPACVSHKAHKSSQIAKKQLEQHLPAFVASHLNVVEGTTAENFCQELETIHKESYPKMTTDPVVVRPVLSPSKKGISTSRTKTNVVESTKAAPFVASGEENNPPRFASNRSVSFEINENIDDNIKTPNLSTPVKGKNQTSTENATTPLMSNLKNRFWSSLSLTGQQSTTSNYQPSSTVPDATPTPAPTPQSEKKRPATVAGLLQKHRMTEGESGRPKPDPMPTPQSEKKRPATEAGLLPKHLTPEEESGPPTPNLNSSYFSSPFVRSTGIPIARSGRFGLFSPEMDVSPFVSPVGRPKPSCPNKAGGHSSSRYGLFS